MPFRAMRQALSGANAEPPGHPGCVRMVGAYVQRASVHLDVAGGLPAALRTGCVRRESQGRLPDRACCHGRGSAPWECLSPSREPILKIELDPIDLRARNLAAHSSVHPPPIDGPTCPHPGGSCTRGDSAQRLDSAGRSRPDPRQQLAGHRRGHDADGPRSGAGSPARLDPWGAGGGGPARCPDTRAAAARSRPRTLAGTGASGAGRPATRTQYPSPDYSRRTSKIPP